MIPSFLKKSLILGIFIKVKKLGIFKLRIIDKSFGL